MLLLRNEDVRKALPYPELTAELRAAFCDLSTAQAHAPAPAIAELGIGDLEALPAVTRTALAAKVITVFHGNHEHGLPAHDGLVILFDRATGIPLAVIEAGELTARRTAATTALATEYLRRPDAQVLTIIGGGVQAHSHLAALTQFYPYSEIRVCDLDPDAANRLASTHPDARVVESREQAVRGADVVCLCTSAHRPVIDRAWLSDGTHVNSIGFGGGPEVDAATVREARIFVESRARALLPPPAGAHELSTVSAAVVTDLGEIFRDPSRARSDNHTGLTLYKSTGNAVEDAAAASVVYRNACEQGLGSTWAR